MHTFAFPKSSRIITKRDFIMTLRKGKRKEFQGFIVYINNTKSTCARLGICISKKTAPKAVSRNRVKRLLREAFRHERIYLLGFDVVIQIFPIGVCFKNWQQQFLEIRSQCVN